VERSGEPIPWFEGVFFQLGFAGFVVLKQVPDWKNHVDRWVWAWRDPAFPPRAILSKISDRRHVPVKSASARWGSVFLIIIARRG
jgi:hypothetical protein